MTPRPDTPTTPPHANAPSTTLRPNAPTAAPRPKLISTTPLFVVRDLDLSIVFYRRVLGFGTPSLWGEPEPCFAMLPRDAFELMLRKAESPDHIRPNGPSGVWDMYLRIADIAAEEAAIRSAGGKLARGPETTFYQMRELEVIDPDGYRICLAQDVSRMAQDVS